MAPNNKKKSQKQVVVRHIVPPPGAPRGVPKVVWSFSEQADHEGWPPFAKQLFACFGKYAVLRLEVISTSERTKSLVINGKCFVLPPGGRVKVPLAVFDGSLSNFVLDYTVEFWEPTMN